MKALKILHRHLRNEQRIMAMFGFGLDSPELPRPKNVPWIRKRGSDSNGAGLHIDLSVHEGDQSFVREVLPG